MKKADIKVSFSCNNNCKFCIVADKGRHKKKTTHEIMKDIDSAKTSGINEIIFTGGEPTIRKDIFQIIEYASKTGFNKVGIYTNARMLSYPEFTSRLVKCGLNWCLVSLHGHNENIHDSLTQVNGSFRQTTKGIKNIVESGIEVINNITITKTNYTSLSDIINLLKALGVKYTNMTFVDIMGNAFEFREDIVISYCELKPYLIDAIETAKGIECFKTTTENVPLCILGKFWRYARENNFARDKWVFNEPQSDSIDFNKSRTESKFKKKSCLSCCLNDKCEGIRNIYAKIYGDEEFNPIIKQAN